MMFRAKLVLASALLVGLTAQLQAQPPGGGRGGPGGRGGFGGGFGGGGGAAGLLFMEEVRKEVGVTDEQNEKIRKAMEEIGGGRGPGGPGGFGGPGGRGGADLSEEERQKRMEEFRKQAEERAKKTDAALKSVLDEKQMARLEELRIQREGAAALSRPEVAAKLKLSDEQKEKVKTALESGRMDRNAFGGRDASPEDRQKAMAEFAAKREKANADAVAVLTEEQKTAFAALQGEKFEFPQPNFGGRGPGGPGGRGARPPRGND